MRRSYLKSLILIAFFAALTAVGAFIKLPMWPVSISLQFLFTALAGVLLGGRRAAASQLVYLLIGLIGVPVFTEGGGIAYLSRPSFGFLLALIPAAYLIGTLAAKWKKPIGIAAACAAGLGILYLIGVPYMYAIVRYGLGANMTPAAAVYSGMLLFLPGDALKIAAVTALAPQIRKQLGSKLS